MAQVVIGTAGHIDHGKTTLVKALTGTDTDRLAEEQARGMTIDLGFAFLDDNITIIDVPGHEKFIRNMVSGVSTIQIALFVIAADDGVMPQTTEHLQILSLLGIPQGVIALTKTDLADDEWIELVEDDIRQLCHGTFLEDAPIIHTSTANGSGIDDLKTILIEQASKVQGKQDRGFFRLQVDRNFTKTGFGAVVTGTVVSGELNKGDDISVLPAEETARVRGLQSHGKSVELVKMGDRAAVNLVGLDKSDLWRGAELVNTGWMKPTSQIIANVTMIPKTRWKLKSKQRVHIHIGTQELLGRVTTINSVLKQGDTANIIIKFESPAVAAMDDHFVIRSYSPMETIGGGIILDTQPQGSIKIIKKWADGLSSDPEERYLQFIDKEFRNPKSIEEWSLIFHQSPLTIHLSRVGDLIYSDLNFKKSNIIIIKCLNDFHKQNPYQKMMKGEELREKVKFSGEWLEFVLSKLISTGKVRQIQTGYALADYSIELSATDQKNSDSIAQIINKFDFEPVSTKIITEETGINNKKLLELLHILKGQKQVEEICGGLWIGQNKLSEMTVKLRHHFTKNDALTVGDFKDLTGLTRKSAIPLLEYFDSQKITVRSGNERLKGKAL